MGIFDSKETKWAKKHENCRWNKVFSRFELSDSIITKAIVYKCLDFSDKLLASDLFSGANLELRAKTIILAKMQFYHLVTKSATVHNLFYGYIHEAWIHHLKEDLETTNLLIDRMRESEKWYLTYYYDWYDSSVGDFAPVISTFCDEVSHITNTEEIKMLIGSEDDLHRLAANFLLDMHVSFMDEMK